MSEEERVLLLTRSLEEVTGVFPIVWTQFLTFLMIKNNMPDIGDLNVWHIVILFLTKLKIVPI